MSEALALRCSQDCGSISDSEECLFRYIEGCVFATLVVTYHSSSVKMANIAKKSIGWHFQDVSVNILLKKCIIRCINTHTYLYKIPTHIMEYYSAVRKKEILPFVTT